MQMQAVTGGLQFPEGPVAMADGSVVLVEMRRGTLTRVMPDGRHESLRISAGVPMAPPSAPMAPVMYVTTVTPGHGRKGTVTCPAVRPRIPT